MSNASQPKSGISTMSYCRAYLWCSVIFYVLLPFFAGSAFVMPVGAHAPYYILFLYMLMVMDWGVLASGIHVLVLIVASELVFFLAMIAVTKLARKGKMLPFLLFMICSHVISVSPSLLGHWISGSGWPALGIMCGYIGNTIFLILFCCQYFKERKERRFVDRQESDEVRIMEG